MNSELLIAISHVIIHASCDNSRRALTLGSIWFWYFHWFRVVMFYTCLEDRGSEVGLVGIFGAGVLVRGFFCVCGE